MKWKALKWWMGCLLIAGVLAAPLYMSAVDDLESQKTIFHDVWNRGLHRLMAINWSGPSAADVMESEKTVLNDAWDRVNHRLRVSAIAYAATPPLICEPGAEFFRSSVTQCLYVCNEAGIDWIPDASCDGGGGSSTTGIRWDATSILSMRPAVTTTATDMTLAQHLIVRVMTAGTLKTISLPNPADPLVGGLFEVIVGDTGAGTVRLMPTAGATINDVAAPTDAVGSLGTITGKGSYYKIKRVSDTEWEVDKFAPSTAGDVFKNANNVYGAFTQDFSAATVILPASVGGNVRTDQANTYGAFNQNFSAATVTLPAAHVRTDQAATYGAFAQNFAAATVTLPSGIAGYAATGAGNTWSTGAQSFAAATSLIVPGSAGYAPTVDGSIGYDTTKEALVSGNDGETATFSRVRSVTSPGQTLTNSTTSEQLFTSVYSIPASRFKAGKIICVRFVFKYVTDSAASSVIFGLNFGATRVFMHASSFVPPNSATRSFSPTWCAVSTGAPGASVGVNTAALGALEEWITTANNTTQPVLLATNGALTVVPTVTYGTNTNGESMTLVHAIIEEMN